jgi:hypothetical protein
MCVDDRVGEIAMVVVVMVMVMLMVSSRLVSQPACLRQQHARTMMTAAQASCPRPPASSELLPPTSEPASQPTTRHPLSRHGTTFRSLYHYWSPVPAQLHPPPRLIAAACARSASICTKHYPSIQQLPTMVKPVVSAMNAWSWYDI